MITITFPVEPVVKKRPRIGKWGAYTPAITVKHERELQSIARAQYRGDPLPGPVKATVLFIFKPPKKPKYTYPSRGDVDNFQKAVGDALNGILWADDVHIVHWDAKKLYDMTGGQSRIVLHVESVQIQVGPLSDGFSRFAKATRRRTTRRPL